MNTDSRMDDKKIAFIGWNPFQFYHIQPALIKIPNARFILEMRRGREKYFDNEILDKYSDKIIKVNYSEIGDLDGDFSTVVCQTPFTHIHRFEKTRIAMIQYGYAKEPHNYGAWRVLADLNMVYGSYAAERIEPLSPVRIVGNPLFDEWCSHLFHYSSRIRLAPYIKPSRKTLLYAPTWGDLSTLKEHINEVISLSDDFNVFIKLHHNTEILERFKNSEWRHNRNVHFFGSSVRLVELMTVTDLVISDYSGAIFDAILCQRPVILINISTPLASEKLDEFSLEYSRRADLGRVLTGKYNLRAEVYDVLKNHKIEVAQVDSFRSNLFLIKEGVADRIALSLEELDKGVLIPTSSQIYLRQEIRELFRYRSRYQTSLFKRMINSLINRITR